MQPKTPSSRSVSPARSSSSSTSSSSSSVLVVTSVADSESRSAGMEGKSDGDSAGGILSVDWQAGILEKLRQVVGSAAQASSRSGDSEPAKSKGEEREVPPPVQSERSELPRSSECAFPKALGLGAQAIIRLLETLRLKNPLLSVGSTPVWLSQECVA